MISAKFHKVRARADATLWIPERGVVERIFVQVGDILEEGAPIAELRVPAWAEVATKLNSTQAKLRVQSERLEEQEHLREQGLVSQGTRSGIAK